MNAVGTHADGASGPRGATALGGLCVLECAQSIAGPFCGKLLAGMGADVTKIEPPRVGDVARHHEPFFADQPDPEGSGLFLYLNADKRSVTLDLRSATGRELFDQLVKQADVLIEDARPDDLQPLGLDYPRLQVINPQLIEVSVTPFGRTGPHSTWKAYEVNVFHGGGEGYLLPNGLAYELAPDREPLKAGGYTADYHAGVSAAIGALGALYARAITGAGQHVDVSKQEAQTSLNMTTISRYLNGTLETRTNRSFTYCGVLPCEDGYVEVLTLDQHQWERLVDLMGSPAWAQEERFREPLSRGQHGAEINRYLREWSRDFTREELYRRAQEKGVPLGPYYTPEDVVNSEHEQARGFFASIDHPRTGPVVYPTWPYKLSATPPRLERGAPLLGQHNREILCEQLGVPVEDLPRLATTGVI